MIRARLGSALAAVVAGALGGCGGGCNLPPTPTSETCELVGGGARPVVTQVELGQERDGGFAPIAADDVVPLVTGGQGTDMIVATLRVTGTGLRDCILQVTRLETLAGEEVSSEHAPIQARLVAPDVWVTGSILLPYYYGSGQRVRLVTTVGDATAEVTFWADYRGDDVDAAATDAAAADAAITDAPTADAATDAATDAAPDA